ncbi:putative hematopoietic cell-specific Lyn substrate 1 [Citreicella sp. SE45]|nr:putative hematopoietic cell-specific Lyn substrate 1 [Citreicella sp. SE45]
MRALAGQEDASPRDDHRQKDDVERAPERGPVDALIFQAAPDPVDEEGDAEPKPEVRVRIEGEDVIERFRQQQEDEAQVEGPHAVALLRDLAPVGDKLH